jgi:polyisoprenoid-binding protein YceI
MGTRIGFLNLVAVTIMVVPAVAQMQSWSIDSAHSSAQFAVRHLGISTVRGAFTKVSGSVQYDSADPTKTTIDSTIDASSVDTRVEMRDNDLRSPNFFDVAKYPSLTFKSKRMEAVGSGKLKLTGDLTIHGVTRGVVLNVDGPSAAVKDPRGNLHIGAAASTTIDRKDFGVNGAGPMVGDDVTITIDLEMTRPSGS